MTENERGPSAGPSHVTQDRSVSGYRTAQRELERLRTGIWRAIEAHEDGNAGGAYFLRRALVEDGPE
jgi:hypothetical protein